MPTSFDGLRGDEIRSKLLTVLDTNYAVLRGLAERDWIPLEARQRVYRETVAESRQALSAARQAMAAWADSTRADTRAIIDAEPELDAATAAAEAASETRITREIALATSRGETHRKQSAEEYAARASDLYDRGQVRAAKEAARIAEAIASPGDRHSRLAREVLGLVQYREWSAVPEKAEALRRSEAIPALEGIFHRDATGRMARLLRSTADAARGLGLDTDVNPMLAESARYSSEAKMTAYAISQANGEPYRDPVGATEGLPTGKTPPVGVLPLTRSR